MARGKDFYLVSATPDNLTTIFGDQFRSRDCFPPTVNVHIVTYNQLMGLFSGHSALQTWSETTLIDFQKLTTVWLRHYFHFMEELIGLWLMLSTIATSSNVARLLFPGDYKNSFVPNSFNDLLIKAAFGNGVKIMHESTLLQQRTPIRIENVLTESRFLAHVYDILSIKHNAMSWGICRVLWSPKRIEMLQQQVFRYLNISAHAPEQPTLIYIDRQTSHQRRLSNSTHTELLAEFATLIDEGWRVIIAKPEQLSFREQVILFAQAHVIVGVHGNGLSNIFWASPNAGVIELQPTNRRQMHYEWLALVASLNYVPLDSEGVEWAARYNSPTDQMNYANITIDPKLVTKIARSWKGRLKEPRWKMQNYF